MIIDKRRLQCSAFDEGAPVGIAPGLHSAQAVTNASQAATIAEYLPIYEPLNRVALKVITSIDHMKGLACKKNV